MVSQVTAVAILMIVQGSLEMVMGLLYVFAALIMPAFFEEVARQQQAQGAPNPFQGGFPAHVASLMAAAGFVPGLLRIVAGIRNLRFHGRTMGNTSHLVGLLSIGTCYCSLTSIGLAIYGLIVYFNSDVAYAFKLGEEGVPSGEIKARYYSDPTRFQMGIPREREGRRADYDDDEERPLERPAQREQGDQFYGEDFHP
jgi:hypothetical protein